MYVHGRIFRAHELPRTDEGTTKARRGEGERFRTYKLQVSDWWNSVAWWRYLPTIDVYSIIHPAAHVRPSSSSYAEVKKFLKQLKNLPTTLRHPRGIGSPRTDVFSFADSSFNIATGLEYGKNGVFPGIIVPNGETGWARNSDVYLIHCMEPKYRLAQKATIEVII